MKSRKMWRHWYEVRYSYKRKDGIEAFNIVKKIGLKKRSDILCMRKIKTINGSMYEIKQIRKHLCNGTVGVEVLCYLGKFRT